MIGIATSMELGNTNWESTTFNSRLQPTEIALGRTSGATDLLKLDYTYGSTANNGNVLSQTITVPTVGSNTGFAAVQTYSYDSLNRIHDAVESVTPTGGSASESWKQMFSYDRYGNRRFNESNTTMPVSFSNEALTNPTISASNNRLTSTGWGYDSSGNTTGDPSGRTFVYDAENKQVSVSNGSGTVGEYFYDGDGRRVKKIVLGTGEITVFVYDAAGKSIAEYSTSVASVEDAKVAYLTADHLGSPRINTDRDGTVTARHDYHPFGEEIGGVGGRITDLNYGDDTIRKQFTSYDRDIETSLDYAINRQYSSTLGRFVQVDPYNIIFEMEKGKDSKEKTSILLRYLSQGQIFNKYSYSLNSPLTFADPDGRRPVNKEDRRRIDILQAQADEYRKLGNEAWAADIESAIQQFVVLIDAVPEGEADPVNLRVIGSSIDYIGDKRFAHAESNGAENMRISWKGITVWSGVNTNKCNFFPAAVYVLPKGGNIGWVTKENPSGYENGYAWKSGGPFNGTYDLPSARTVYESGMKNFVETTQSNLKMGDIVASGYHLGIALYGDKVISASGNGVRIGQMDKENRYYTYKP